MFTVTSPNSGCTPSFNSNWNFGGFGGTPWNYSFQNWNMPFGSNVPFNSFGGFGSNWTYPQGFGFNTPWNYGSNSSFVGPWGSSFTKPFSFYGSNFPQSFGFQNSTSPFGYNVPFGGFGFNSGWNVPQYSGSFGMPWNYGIQNWNVPFGSNVPFNSFGGFQGYNVPFSGFGGSQGYNVPFNSFGGYPYGGYQGFYGAPFNSYGFNGFVPNWTNVPGATVGQPIENEIKGKAQVESSNGFVPGGFVHPGMMQLSPIGMPVPGPVNGCVAPGPVGVQREAA